LALVADALEIPLAPNLHPREFDEIKLRQYLSKNSINDIHDFYRSQAKKMGVDPWEGPDYADMWKRAEIEIGAWVGPVLGKYDIEIE